MPLKVLNASAGSGKTYSLVQAYLTILLQEKNQADAFKHIVAMTFTNKAALEMKTRIIKQLDLLAFPERNVDESQVYAAELAGMLQTTAAEIFLRARKVLEAILHRYEDFFVLTIDKFNLRLIRSFCRDLDLPADFEVILNESELVTQVVDQMLGDIGRAGYQELTNLVIQYARHNLDESRSWNIRQELVHFGEVLGKEKDISYIQQLLAMDFQPGHFKTMRDELNAMHTDFAKRCSEAHHVYLRFQDQRTLFPGGQHTYNSLEKLGGIKQFPTDALFSKTAVKCMEQPVPEGKFFPDELRTVLIDLKGFHESHLEEIAKKQLLLKNFHNMSLLSHIAEALEQVKNDEQLIRISEFNSLIAGLVRNEHAPYIYEKLGVRFRHFLLDEFQDTSRLQWLNMVPLLHESLANGFKNLIVGDAKQSIYRFKNGVAEQFVALPGIYNPEQNPQVQRQSAYFQTQSSLMNLEDNWRSSTEIVSFNNRFFEQLITGFPEATQAYYNTISQHPRSSKKGYVHIVSSPIPVASTEYLIDKVVERIKACKEDGFDFSDICLLSETNKKSNAWAIELTRRGYKVVSSDSLLIQKDLKVKLTLSYLRRRLMPHSHSESKRFAELYFRLRHDTGFGNYKLFFHAIEGKPEQTYFNEEAFLSEYFGGRTAFFRKYENLYDLVIGFYQNLGWNELMNPYLHHFADFVHEYELKKGPDLSGLLDHYNEKKSSLAIQVPESKDALQIMTIHKAKGLEFPVVILPEIDLTTSLYSKARFLLSIDDNVVHTTLSKNSVIQEVLDMRTQESNQVLTDKLNLCYVAFTRPQSRLYVLNYHDKGDFGETAHACFQSFAEATFSEEEIEIQFGERQSIEKSQADSSDTTWFTPVNLKDFLWYPDISLRKREELDEVIDLSVEQRFGNQFHAFISRVESKEHLEEVLHAMVKEDLIESAFNDRLLSEAAAFLELSAIQEMYSNAQTILNEQPILIDEGETRRPDKMILKEDKTVVLEFKTGMPQAFHSKQVQDYVSALTSMEMPAVEAYLYYSATKELVRVA
jgi:ATP-dependent exoDNAse (exonuclease V) beta subunit